MKISTNADPNNQLIWYWIDMLDCQGYIKYGNCNHSVAFTVSRKNWKHVENVLKDKMPDVEYWTCA